MTTPPEARKIEERQIRSDWQEFWYKESKNTEQSYLTPDTHGIVIDYLKELYKSHHQELQKAREEERERIKALFPKLNPNSDSWGTNKMERILKAIDN